MTVRITFMIRDISSSLITTTWKLVLSGIEAWVITPRSCLIMQVGIFSLQSIACSPLSSQLLPFSLLFCVSCSYAVLSDYDKLRARIERSRGLRPLSSLAFKYAGRYYCANLCQIIIGPYMCGRTARFVR